MKKKLPQRLERFMTPIDYQETMVWVALEESLFKSLPEYQDLSKASVNQDQLTLVRNIDKFIKQNKKNLYGYYEVTLSDFVGYYNGFIVGRIILTVDQRIFIPYEVPYCIHSDKPPQQLIKSLADMNNKIVGGMLAVEEDKK